MIRPGETVDEWRMRMWEKGQRERAFREREQAASLSQMDARKVKPPPKRRRKKEITPLSSSLAMFTISSGRQPGPVNGPAKGEGGRPRTQPDCCQNPECGVPVYRTSQRGRPHPPGAKRLMGRGLCTTCYPRVRRAEAG